MLYSLQLPKKKFNPFGPSIPPVWDVTLQAPASYVTKQDTGPSPAQPPGHPSNPAPPANNGASGKWIVLRHYPPNLEFHIPGPSSRLQVHPIQTDSELQVIGMEAGHKVSFLIDSGAAFSFLTSFKSPLQLSEVAIEGVSGIPFYPKITPPLLCSFGNVIGKVTLAHSFIVVPQCPMALAGRDLLAKLQTSINLAFLDPISILCIQMAPEPLANPHSQILPPDLPPVDPQAWDNEALLIARHHSHIQVFLKNPSQVITQTQYSLTTESRQGLKPIIS